MLPSGEIYFVCFTSFDIFATRMEIDQVIYCTPCDIFVKNAMEISLSLVGFLKFCDGKS